MKKTLLIISILLLSACSYGNLDYVSERAAAKWKRQGFEVVDYEGYQWGMGGVGSYGGAKVNYRLKKIPDNGITYSGYLQRWGDNLDVYGPVAVDAIRGGK